MTIFYFTTDDQNGMDTQLFTSQAEMFEAIHREVAKDDDELAATMRGMVPGSLDWESTWEAWREHQCRNCNYYSVGQQDIEIPQASTPRASNRHAALPGMLVMQVPTMSTLHITKEDGKRLAEFEAEAVLAEISGGTGHIVDFPDASTIDADFSDYSEAFRAILHQLAAAGFTYVRFDGDHATCDSFPTFEW